MSFEKFKKYLVKDSDSQEFKIINDYDIFNFKSVQALEKGDKIKFFDDDDEMFEGEIIKGSNDVAVLEILKQRYEEKNNPTGEPTRESTNSSKSTHLESKKKESRIVHTQKSFSKRILESSDEESNLDAPAKGPQALKNKFLKFSKASSKKEKGNLVTTRREKPAPLDNSSLATFSGKDSDSSENEILEAENRKEASSKKVKGNVLTTREKPAPLGNSSSATVYGKDTANSDNEIQEPVNCKKVLVHPNKNKKSNLKSKGETSDKKKESSEKKKDPVYETDSDNSDYEQLLEDGEHKESKHIGRKIFAQKRSYKEAKKAKSTSSAAKRLFRGVFKQDAIKIGTLSGKLGNNMSKEKKAKREARGIIPLNDKAVDAIIDFAFLMSKGKDWKVESRAEVRRSISGEISKTKEQEEQKEEKESNGD